MATAIVALYDQGGAPLGAACGLADAMKGFTALHYHSVEAYSVWVADASVPCTTLSTYDPPPAAPGAVRRRLLCLRRRGGGVYPRWHHIKQRRHLLSNQRKVTLTLEVLD